MANAATGGTKLAYSTTEAAQALGISEKHLRNLVAKGEIPSIRLGRRILIPAEQLAKLISRPEVAAS